MARNPDAVSPNLRDRARDLARLPIGLNLRAISLAEGLRAALSVAVIIALNERLHWAALNEAALAALWTCLCDPGGPIRRRLPVLLSFAALGASVTAGVGLARGLGLPVALPLGAFGLFALSFVRVHGQAAGVLGALLSFALILALDRPLPDLATAGALAAGFVGGALWAIVLTLVIWRLHPFLPARRAVAEVYTYSPPSPPTCKPCCPLVTAMPRAGRSTPANIAVPCARPSRRRATSWSIRCARAGPPACAAGRA